MEHFCYGCMRPKTRHPQCEHCGYDERARNELHQLPVGYLLGGQYVIGRVLGQGGFGITYLAWDKNLEEPVAIKEYYPSGQVSRNHTMSQTVTCNTNSSQFLDGRERFLREAQTLAKLRRNPSIVQVHSFFALNNTAYIVMEYVEGVTLQNYIRQRGGRLTASETFAILRPVLQALRRVHEAGMIHRDISPDNIMLQENGMVKLLDFGTARNVSPEAAAHSTQAILKHGFAPFEQYQSRGNLGPWTDEYALCATIYYCLTGRVPVEASSRLMEGDTLSWAQLPELNPRQRMALEKGMAVRPQDRFPDLAALEEALFGTVPVYQTSGTGYQTSGTGYQTGGTGYQTGGTGYQTTAGTAGSGSGKKWLIPVAAGLVAVVALIASLSILSGRKNQEELSLGFQAAETEATTAPAFPPDMWKENVMIADEAEFTQDEYFVFKSKWRREDIRSVTFLNSLANAPGDAWDISQEGDGRVKAWVVPGEEFHDLYIAANGGVCAPVSCNRMFYNYFNVRQFRFDGNFHTDYVEDAYYMFAHCEMLTELDLSTWNTGNIRIFYAMFNSCSLLQQMDMSNFDTSKATRMGEMFYKCYSLQWVDLSSFDTSKVQDMNLMFRDCRALKKLDLSHFDTSKVTTVNHMFAGCSGLEDLELGVWETNVMEKHTRFMDEGVLYKGRPWEELF